MIYSRHYPKHTVYITEAQSVSGELGEDSGDENKGKDENEAEDDEGCENPKENDEGSTHESGAQRVRIYFSAKCNPGSQCRMLKMVDRAGDWHFSASM